MPEYDSMAPYWRSEILEKKKRKKLAVENEIPEWKRDLIKRIHSKKVQERGRMASTADEVVEEHIPKVTENVFLVQEKQHTKSIMRDKQPTDSITTTSVVIIENEQPVTETLISPSMEVQEMPSSGIVSRLMNKFEANKKQNGLRYRSKSVSALRTKVDKPHKAAEEKSVKLRTMPPRAQSVDAKQNFISTVVPIPYHKSHDSVIKSPVLSPKSVSVSRVFELPNETIPIVIENDDKPIDTSLLHAHGDLSKNKITKVDSVEKKELKLPKLVQVSEIESKLKLPNGDRLHSSGNQDSKTSMKEKNDSATTTEVKVQSWRSRKETRAPALPSSYRQNKIDIPKKPTNVNENKSFGFKAQKRKKNDNKAPAYSSFTEEVSESKVNDVSTPEAKFINYILQTSTTVQINPKKNKRTDIAGKKQVITDANLEDKSEIMKSKPPPITNGHCMTEQVETEKLPISVQGEDKENQLPASSIDEVIVIPVEVMKENQAPIALKNEEKLIVSVTETKKLDEKIQSKVHEVKKVEPPGRNIPSIFGTKLRQKSATGTSFVIDPSKFKKSSAAPSPTEQPVATKRTVTVAKNITVIGGFVKLERSCLVTTETKKKKKIASVSFNMKETTHQYVSEKSLIEEHALEILQTSAAKKPNTLPKDSTFGKYTPKYLLSMSAQDIEQEKLTPDSEPSSIATTDSETVATPTDGATKWSEDTSPDILF